MKGEENFHEILILSADSGKVFSKNLLDWFAQKKINARLVNSIEVVFPVGEVKCVLKETIRNKPLYIVQLLLDPTAPHRSVNDNLMSLCTTIHAARQSDSGPITVVIPQFPYSRQDKVLDREPVTCMLVCGLLELAGAQRVLTIDIHNRSIMGFFRKANLVELKSGLPLVDAILQKKDFIKNAEDWIIVAPDAGASKRARAFANVLRYRSHKLIPLAVMEKIRNYHPQEGGASLVDEMILIGQVRGKHVLMIDDMIDTGGTLLKACQLLMETHGAKSVSAAVTFGFFSKNAVQNFQNAYKKGIISTVFGTDAVSWSQEFCQQNPWYVSVSIAPLVAEAIYKIHLGESVSKLLEFNSPEESPL